MESNKFLFLLAEYIDFLNVSLLFNVILYVKLPLQQIFKNSLIYILVFTSLTLSLNVTFSYNQLGAIDTCIQFIFLLFTLRIPFFRRLLTLSLSFFIDGLLTLLFILLLNAQNQRNDPITHLITSLFGLLLITVIAHVFKKKDRKVIPNFSLLFLLLGICGSLLPAISLLFFNDIISQNHYHAIVIISFLTIIATLILFYVYNNAVRQKEVLKNENIFRERLLAQQESYAKLMVSKYDTLRTFKHDIKSYITVIEVLTKEKKYNELNDFVNGMKTEISNTTIIGCEDIYISAIVSQIIGEANLNNISFDFKCILTREVLIEKFEICSLFHNLLTNALENTKKVSKYKYISLKITQFNSALKINVINSVDETFKIDNILNHISTKPEQSIHGIGLYSIESITKKYNGDIKFELNEEKMFFEISIVLLNCLSV